MAKITRAKNLDIDYSKAISYQDLMEALTNTYNELVEANAENIRVVLGSFGIDGEHVRFIYDEDYDVPLEDLISAISRANHELISGLMNVYVTDEEFVQLIKDKL